MRIALRSGPPVRTRSVMLCPQSCQFADATRRACLLRVSALLTRRVEAMVLGERSTSN